MRSAGPRGPSGVTAIPLPARIQRMTSRNAWAPPLALAGSLGLAVEPRIAGKPSRAMASDTKPPSAESEISARGLCARSSGQHAGERPMRACQKHTITPPPPSHTPSARSRPSQVQRVVASAKRR